MAQHQPRHKLLEVFHVSMDPAMPWRVQLLKGTMPFRTAESANKFRAGLLYIEMAQAVANSLIGQSFLQRGRQRVKLMEVAAGAGEGRVYLRDMTTKEIEDWLYQYWQRGHHTDGFACRSFTELVRNYLPDNLRDKLCRYSHVQSRACPSYGRVRYLYLRQPTR